MKEFVPDRRVRRNGEAMSRKTFGQVAFDWCRENGWLKGHAGPWDEQQPHDASAWEGIANAVLAEKRRRDREDGLGIPINFNPDATMAEVSIKKPESDE